MPPAWAQAPSGVALQCTETLLECESKEQQKFLQTFFLSQPRRAAHRRTVNERPYPVLFAIDLVLFTFVHTRLCSPHNLMHEINVMHNILEQ